MILTYLPLPHIPSPPDHYIEQALVHQTAMLEGAFEGGGFGSSIDIGYITRSVVRDGQTYQSRRQRRFILPEDFTQWCKDNIDPGCYNGSICTNEGVDPYHGPHIDPYRNYGLLYVVDAGGENVITSWWQKKDCPTMYSLQEYPPLMYDDYGNLDPLESLSMLPNTWYLINVRVLHSVENITHRRITLQCAINDSSSLESAVLQKNNS